MLLTGNPRETTALHGFQGLDLPLLRELGLDLIPLEDRRPGALMPSLRAAAATCVGESLCGNAPTREMNERLHHTYSQVITAMQIAEAALALKLEEGVSIDHPAIQRFADRNPAASESSHRLSSRSLASFIIGSVRLGLFYPLGDPTTLYNREQAEYIPVTRPYSATALPAEDELIDVRIAAIER